MRIKGCASALLVFVVSIFSVAYADTPIYKTALPEQILGFDVYPEQKVAIRFSPHDDFTLNYINLWFMNNAQNGFGGEVTLTLNEDELRDSDGKSQPSNTVLESWVFEISSVGWDIKKETVKSQLKPSLKHNQRYWLIAKSKAPKYENPVWNVAGGNIIDLDEAPAQDVAVSYGGIYEKNVKQWHVGYGATPSVQIYGDFSETSD